MGAVRRERGDGVSGGGGAALGGKVVAATRPMPGVFDVGDAAVRFGPSRGFESRGELFEFVRGADAVVSWVSERVDAEFLREAGERLKIVANFAVGYDNIDVGACREAGVFVSNTPDAVTDGTADCAVMLMLAAARWLSSNDVFARSGAWAEYGVLGPVDRLGQPIGGWNEDGTRRSVLIVGGGRIGYATAVRLVGFGLRVMYVSRESRGLFEGAPLFAERVGLDEGLRRADFVSLHVPLTGETRHLIGARELGLMKSSAVLVNTARGAVVDEGALVEALRAGRIWGAGLDVFEDEPRVHEGLVGLENVVMTPHFGSGSFGSRAKMSALVAANVRAVLGGGEPVTPVV